MIVDRTSARLLGRLRDHICGPAVLDVLIVGHDLFAKQRDQVFRLWRGGRSFVIARRRVDRSTPHDDGFCGAGFCFCAIFNL